MPQPFGRGSGCVFQYAENEVWSNAGSDCEIPRLHQLFRVENGFNRALPALEDGFTSDVFQNRALGGRRDSAQKGQRPCNAEHSNRILLPDGVPGLDEQAHPNIGAHMIGLKRETDSVPAEADRPGPKPNRVCRLILEKAPLPERQANVCAGHPTISREQVKTAATYVLHRHSFWCR